MEWTFLYQNSRCPFWHHLEIFRQHIEWSKSPCGPWLSSPAVKIPACGYKIENYKICRVKQWHFVCNQLFGLFYQNQFMANITFRRPWWASPLFVMTIFAIIPTLRSRRNYTSYTARLSSVRTQWTPETFTFGVGGYLLKTIFSIYFTREGCVSIEGLPKRERFNSTFFTFTILPNIIGSINMLHPKIWAQGDWPHIENLTILLCHFRKLTSWESPDWLNHLIALALDPVTSSHSVTWTNNSMRRTVGPKTRWSLWWEDFDQDPHS
jgi:hypothetical protein